jgi:imidazolonepropionase-like amidohydrolase/ABC-type multidrug transport system permease subunit
MRAYIAYTQMVLRLTMRDRMVIFFNYLFPLIFFFIFGQIMHAEQGGAAPQLVNMVLSMGILGSGFFGGGMRAVMDREANILRRFKVAPISPGPILFASLVAGLVHYLPLVVLVLALAHFLYGMAIPTQLPLLLFFAALGLFAFRAIGGIIGAVANSMQESQVIIQLLYFPMLFLGGATFPLGAMGKTMQAVSEFIPSKHLSVGLTGILVTHSAFMDILSSAGVLALTTVIGMFLAMKLFRWEKEEKLKPSAKLWILGILAPFILMGAWQVRSKDNAAKVLVQERAMRRGHTSLIQNARLIAGDGSIVERGSVLVKGGQIAEIYTGESPDPKSLKADGIEGAGKTLMPGLIDVHVHLGSPGGFYENPTDYKPPEENMPRELAAYLFSGVTAVKSLGDTLPDMLRERARMRSGEKLGAELFVVGPLFTAEGGHGTEYSQNLPAQMRAQFEANFVRIPKSAEEARKMVMDLKAQGVDGIKAILEGLPPFKRMDVGILKAIAAAAHEANLPIVCHTGNAQDVADAVDAGVDGVEHGSNRDAIPAELFAKMKAKGVVYDPTLAVVEAMAVAGQGRTDPLERSLVQQVGPPALLQSTKRVLAKGESAGMRANFARTAQVMNMGKENLIAAYRAGVTLVMGTDSGNPLLVHGPAIHRELQLWVDAGVPRGDALRSALWENARLLRASNRIGLLKKGYEANLLLVDGNPVQDISLTEHISMVMLKGERIARAELFEEK